MPEMLEPQKVLVMVPRDSPSRPAVVPKAGNMAGVMPGQAPGESRVILSSLNVPDSELNC